MRRIVMVALGGHALLKPGQSPSMQAQFKNARRALQALLPLLKEGASLCLTHGNGPQVGNILIRSEESLGKAYRIPLEVAVGQSEGEIGYLLQQSLVNLLTAEGIVRDVVGLLTQVEVDPGDKEFRRPTKPVGPWLSRLDANLLKEQRRPLFHDAERGWRRLVPSPRPLRIVEARVVADLVHRGVIVIAAGGGGIPVARRRGRLEGVPAVIDKDRAAGLLARQLRADLLLLLTGVEQAALHHGTRKERKLGLLGVADAGRYLEQGHFPPGSMGPKVEAAIEFLTNGGREAIITTPEKLRRALAGKGGTRIVP